MLMGELITAHTHQLPLTVVVFNNSSLGMIRLEIVAGYPYYQTDHGLVDYAAIAAACGCRPAPWTIRPRFATLSRRRWRTLVDVRTDPNALSLPPHRQQVKGLALASTKTVLDGGVGRMLELAHSNLRNISRPGYAPTAAAIPGTCSSTDSISVSSMR